MIFKTFGSICEENPEIVPKAMTCTLHSKVNYGVRSPKFIWAPCAFVHSCTHWLRHLNPLPAFGLIYERALLVSQDRRHLFVTPCQQIYQREVQPDQKF